MTNNSLNYFVGWMPVDDGRLDSEYYWPSYRQFNELLLSQPHRFIRDVATMRRPQYRTTETLLPGTKKGTVKFLSPTDVENFQVDWNSVPEVSESIWDEYPSGRATPGDLLLEVKGEAKKVFKIGEDVPAKTMVSGSFQQIHIKNPTEAAFVFATLLSTVWTTQRSRLQSNINIKYVDKAALNSAILPWPDPLIRHAIASKVLAAECIRLNARRLCELAQDKLSNLLGTLDRAHLRPNLDGSCDHFSAFVSPDKLKLFAGAQFYGPKRKSAIDLVMRSGPSQRIGSIGGRVRSKAKRSLRIAHIDPSNVVSGDGYWFSAEDEDGGDVALAEPLDVLFLRMRPYLNKTTLNDSRTRVSTSPEYLIYRFTQGPDDPYYSALCLRQPWALAQVAEIATGDRPRVDGEFVDDILIPWPHENTRGEIGRLYKLTFALRRRADELLKQSIQDIEDLIRNALDRTNCIEVGRSLIDEFKLELVK